MVISDNPFGIIALYSLNWDSAFIDFASFPNTHSSPHTRKCQAVDNMDALGGHHYMWIWICPCATWHKLCYGVKLSLRTSGSSVKKSEKV